ncbi:Uncharacterized membrane protein YfhO [Pilibacter termitis]|uniref:Uncharacterized membrane protein YfhO n=1 Tax=Pilibacter termitis TaxID=263852 RepID=A0A1T4LJ29_9ENTE|nr:YfhO family protein [Pilibacter termitis]SJZ54641.1 Uncharacterized membrane protein YfhO [Pilibacter termitis]
MKLNKRTIGLNVLSFLLPLFCLTILFSILQITPFGQKNLMISDLGTQYTPFFSYLKEIFSGKESWIYSFSVGMGDNFLPLTAYYLMSPFNLLFLLVDSWNLDTMVSIVLMLKISCMSIMMFTYLRKSHEKAELSQVFFSLAYALSGFVGIYATNIMWLDGLIFFPLVVLGIERLIDKGHGKFYMFMLFCTIVTNYYLGYMTCLFSVCYYVYYSLKQTEIHSIKEYLITRQPSRLCFLKYSIFGGVLSSFILVPALVGMIKTGKGEFQLDTYAPYPKFSTEFFMQLGFDNTDYTTRLEHLPSFYVGLLTLFLVFLLFQLKMSKKELFLRIGLILALFLSFFVQSFNAVWHMFQETAGFPYRNSFMLSFVLLVFAYDAWVRREEVTKKQVVRTGVILASLLAIGYLSMYGLSKSLDYEALPIETQDYYRSFTLNFHLLALSLIFLLGYVMIFMQKRSKYSLFALLMLLLVDVNLNFFQMMRATPFGDAVVFTQKERELNYLTTELSDILHTRDDDFYRINNEVYGIDNGYNQALSSHYYSIPNYSSTLNNNLRKTLKKLGLFSRNERRISDVGLTPFTSYLLDIEYVFTESRWGNTEPVAQRNNYYAYKNQAADSAVGYFFDDDLLDLKLESEKPYENQEKLAKIAMNDENFTLFEPVELKQKGMESWTFSVKELGQLYLYLPDERFEELEVWVNDEKIAPRINVNHSALIRLGTAKTDKEYTIEVMGLKKTEDIYSAIRLMPAAKSSQVSETLAKGSYKAKYIAKDNFFSGNVRAEKDGVLFTSIPYDSEWLAQLDGKPAKVIPVLNGAFVGIKLSKGEHSVSFRYLPKSFLLGVGITGFAFVSLLILEFTDRRKKLNLR